MHFLKNAYLKGLCISSVSVLLWAAAGFAMQPNPAEQQAQTPNQLGEHLFEALNKRNVQEALRLVEAGANVKGTDYAGRTPLHVAAGRDMREIVKALVDKGADVNALDRSQRTPLYLASGLKNPQTALALIGHGGDLSIPAAGGGTPLHYAVGQDLYKTARALAVKGAPVNARDDRGRTPLHRAVEENGESTKNFIELLLKQGADPDARNQQDETALKILAKKSEKAGITGYRYQEEMKALIAGGASGVKKLPESVKKEMGPELTGLQLEGKARRALRKVEEQRVRGGNHEANLEALYRMTKLHGERGIRHVLPVSSKGEWVPDLYHTFKENYEELARRRTRSVPSPARHPGSAKRSRSHG